MTPQMQQSIQLLQMNSMDLEQLIREEMMENPFLEMSDEEEGLRSAPDEGGVDGESAPAEPESGLSESAAPETPEYDEPAEPREEYSDFSAPAPEEGFSGGEETFSKSEPATEGSEEFGTFAENDVNWNEEFEDSDTSSYGSTREDTEEHDFTTYTGATTSLYDSLNRQLHLSILGGRQFEIGQFIIGNLDTDGYLDSSLPNLCLMVGYPAELVEPDIAGSADRVDTILRKMLAKLHGGENPDAFIGMKRREITSRIVADLIKVSYDEAAAMKKDEQFVHLLARRMKREYEDLAAMEPPDLVLEVLAHRLKTTSDEVFDVLEVIQDFEPTGIAARDLAECLRLQCEEKEIRNRVLYQILDGHLSDLQQKRFREVANALNVSEDKVTEVFTLLSHLDPKPGRSITKDEARYITPDVYVKKVDGKYMYFLNEGDAGRLKVASNYRRMVMQKTRGKHAQADAAKAALNGFGVHPSQNGNAATPDGAASAEGAVVPYGRWQNFSASPTVNQDAEYASEKYKNAVWLIRNIEKRKSTILRVTEAIMEYQKEFLEKGIEHLRPLTLRDIAERVGMHESTIARVTTKKYVEMPRGIFELKFFFSSGLETDEGEAASSRSIKELLTQMIEAEEKKRPLSDQKIADMLRQKGFQIARRTVAKYREQLKILPAKLRKEVK
ncbi:hypothetical protein BH09SUM1_BH09SUM1_21900 [soil metagenome]